MYQPVAIIHFIYVWISSMTSLTVSGLVTDCSTVTVVWSWKLFHRCVSIWRIVCSYHCVNVCVDGWVLMLDATEWFGFGIWRQNGGDWTSTSSTTCNSLQRRNHRRILDRWRRRSTWFCSQQAAARWPGERLYLDASNLRKTTEAKFLITYSVLLLFHNFCCEFSFYYYLYYYIYITVNVNYYFIIIIIIVFMCTAYMSLIMSK